MREDRHTSTEVDAGRYERLRALDDDPEWDDYEPEPEWPKPRKGEDE